MNQVFPFAAALSSHSLLHILKLAYDIHTRTDGLNDLCRAGMSCFKVLFLNLNLVNNEIWERKISE